MGFPSATLPLKLRSFLLTIQIPASSTCFNATPTGRGQEILQVPLRLDTVPAEPAPPHMMTTDGRPVLRTVCRGRGPARAS